jgi:putative hydrolase of the HAD superfamily
MDLAPSQAVFVGDTPESDVLGAQGAGLDVIWIDRGITPLASGTPPTHTVSSFVEIAGLL